MTVLAIDPGAKGAAVLVEGERVLAWWAWTLLRRTGGEVYRLRRSTPTPDEAEVPTLGVVGQRIGDAVLWVTDERALVVEGLFVPRAGQGLNIQTHTALAESAGWLMGGLGLGVPVARPLASVWRAAVLSKARLDKDAAERLAVQATRWEEWPGDPLARLSGEELGACAEARLMARWWLTCGRKAA